MLELTNFREFPTEGGVTFGYFEDFFPGEFKTFKQK